MSIKVKHQHQLQVEHCCVFIRTHHCDYSIR